MLIYNHLFCIILTKPWMIQTSISGMLPQNCPNMTRRPGFLFYPISDTGNGPLSRMGSVTSEAFLKKWLIDQEQFSWGGCSSVLLVEHTNNSWMSMSSKERRSKQATDGIYYKVLQFALYIICSLTFWHFIWTLTLTTVSLLYIFLIFISFYITDINRFSSFSAWKTVTQPTELLPNAPASGISHHLHMSLYNNYFICFTDMSLIFRLSIWSL